MHAFVDFSFKYSERFQKLAELASCCYVTVIRVQYSAPPRRNIVR